MAEALAQGYQLVFFTLTLRHHRGEALKDVWGALGRSWRRMNGGRGALMRMPGVVGFVRTQEVTWGARNGWHPHVHGFLVVEKDAPWQAIWGEMQRRWFAALAVEGAEGLPAAQHAKLIEDENAARQLSDYALDVGQSLARELMYQMPGRSKGDLGTLDVFSVLAGAVEDGDAEMMDLWWEWEKASKGKRSVGWSKGLRETLGVGAEMTDEEIAGQELGSSEHDVLRVRDWAQVARVDGLPSLVLDVMEIAGRAGVAGLLGEWAVEFDWVDPPD